MSAGQLIAGAGILFALVQPGVTPPPSTAFDTSGYRFRRPIAGGPAGLTSVRLDAAALAHTRLADLRIVTSDGRQVPYVLEKLEDPLAIPLAIERASRRDLDAEAARGHAGVHSVYRLGLPEARLPPARLVLTTSSRVFDRRARILVEHGAPSRYDDTGFGTVVSASWRHADPDQPAPALAVDLPSLGSRDAWLVVDEGDNSPLPIDGATLLLPSYRLRFFRDADVPLSLIYGNPESNWPRYDLALLAPRLADSGTVEAALGAEPPPQAASSRWHIPSRLFWGVLIAAVVVLLALVVRLMSARP